MRRAKAVTDGVLDAQRDEFEALERALLRRYIDTQRPVDREKRGPIDRGDRVVDIAFARIVEFRDLPEHARSEPRAQVGRVAAGRIAVEGHSTRHA